MKGLHMGRWPITAAAWAMTGTLLSMPGVMTAVKAAESLLVPRSGSIALPLEGVQQIISSDEDVAIGKFSGGKAYIEGISSGTTKVEVLGRNAQRRVFTVRVMEASAIPAQNTTKASVAPVATTGNRRVVEAPAPATAATEGLTPIEPGTPVVSGPDGTAVVQPSAGTAIVAPSNLQISLRVAPVTENPSQALFTVSFSNQGNTEAQDVRVRFALDDAVSYVTGSATGGAKYDPAGRELVWDLGDLRAGGRGSATFRVQPINPQEPVTFYSVATIEDASGVSVASKPLTYNNSPTPLLTVFALPDRIMAGKTAPVMVDVRGAEYQTSIDRMQAMGIVNGKEPGLYYPNAPAQRAEYTVMTLRALNLRDLRDMSAIKFVLGRRAVVDLDILNSDDKVVASLVKNNAFDAGEHAVIWDGRIGTGFARPGTYTYICTAVDAKNMKTELRGQIYIMPQTPVLPSGTPSFSDIKPNDWHAGYIATAQKQALVRGYPDGTFRPSRPINRTEATVIAVRAIGLADVAKDLQGRDVGYQDNDRVPKYAVGSVAAASTVAKTAGGKPLMRGTPNNFFNPLQPLDRGDAALIAQRIVDRETNRKISISGQLVPGATVTIQGQTVRAGDDGRFQLVLDLNTVTPITVAVVDARR